MYYINNNEGFSQNSKASFLFDDGNCLWSFRESHRFYQAYLAWVAEGNTAEEWSPNGD